MVNAALVSDGYPTGEQSFKLNLARHFDLPVYTAAQSNETSHSIDVHRIDVDFPPLVGSLFQDAIKRLHYSFWNPPSAYDIIITSGLSTQSLAQWPEQDRIHYFHGIHRGSFGYPARDHYSENSYLKVAQRANRMFIRVLNSISFDMIDTVVANSEFTSNMIKRLYNYEVDEIIHPSFVEVDKYGTDRTDRGEFYLYLGRLADAKGVREIVTAFNELDLPLRVAGRGPLQAELTSQANDNVEILGYISEEKKRSLLSHCRGVINNTISEPFGIVTVEALASGSPVIGSNTGNNPHLITDNETGVLFSYENGGETYQRPDSAAPLINAIKRAESISWDHDHIQSVANRYDKATVLDQWDQLLN
jgi:glycosyltransferase involved in cell wall biosynthesis